MYFLQYVCAFRITSHQIKKIFSGLLIDLANNDPIRGADDTQSDDLITKQKAFYLVFIHLEGKNKVQMPITSLN